MVSSPKSPRETKIIKPPDSSLALVSVAPLATIILMYVDGISHIVSLNSPPPSPTIEKNHSSDPPLFLLPEASSEGESREHATIRVTLDGSSNSSSTTDEIPLANLVPTKGRRRLRTLNRKLVSNPVFEASPPIANLSILGVRVPQTWQKRRQAEADLSSTLAATKRTHASARTLPTTPGIVISDDDVVLYRVRRGKHIASKSSCSKPNLPQKP
ncbi:hypothetical protein KY284_010698 [Solanum tuberosum]|nr:hypothetical protein KY284_010698 [Solanum tuberosum]